MDDAAEGPEIWLRFWTDFLYICVPRQEPCSPPTKQEKQEREAEVRHENTPPTKMMRRGEKAPTTTLSVLLRKRPVLLRADFVLTKDPKWPYEGQFCGKVDREESCSKAVGVLRKDEIGPYPPPSKKLLTQKHS